MTREELEASVGPVWDTQELQRDFSMRSFFAPYVLVVRKTDQKQGTLAFQASPRFYHSFRET